MEFGRLVKLTYHVEWFKQTSHVLVFFRGHTLVDVVNVVVIGAVLLVLLLWIFNKDFFPNKYEIVSGHVTEIRRNNQCKQGSFLSGIEQILRTICSSALCWCPKMAVEAVCWFSVSFYPKFSAFHLPGPVFSLRLGCGPERFSDGSSCYTTALCRQHSNFRR